MAYVTPTSKTTGDLIAATHGRSFWVLDISPLQELTPAVLSVSPTGDVTGLQAGIGTVRAASGSASGTATVTVNQGSAPFCTLSASPSTITSGSSSILTASCSPAATSYVWTGGTCAGNATGSCTAMPTMTTAYTVVGSNGAGAGNTNLLAVDVLAAISRSASVVVSCWQVSSVIKSRMLKKAIIKPIEETTIFQSSIPITCRTNQ